ncbi:RNA-binding protein 44-like [Protopterus annectens]|uniref:RNA-binding protein 44-like n=1 Tax=Protopterus annectens TaxID=7888 RepID=UPI001CFB6271|nr:RNA-binding protein 44-like [Protopterus annectens]
MGYSNDGNKDDQSSTYQALKQRAVKAELQLLELQYFMCVQHCLRLHQLVLEEKECFTTQGVLSECASAVEHSSSMSLILQDLRNKYLKMKDALLSGCALDSFPPFSVELKGNLGFTTYVPLQERRTTEQFITGSASTRTRDLSHQSRACNEGKNTFEIIQDGAVIGHDTTEDWFDAEENIDPNKSSRFQGQRSGGCSDRDKEVRKLGTIPKTGTKTDQEANEKWFDADEGHKCEGCSAGDVQIQNMKTIHDPAEVNFSGVTEDKPKELHHVFLGGLPVGVSEEDLRFHFKKFPFSELYISDGSLKTRYAVLAFKTARDAERTTLEMSGSEIQGQAIKAVRIVPSEECSSCFSSFPSSTPVMISGSKDVQKNCKRMQKLCNMPTASGTFVPQNSANLSSFTKVVKRLTEMHSHSSRNEIFEALSEVRSKNNGSLNGLPISTIIERASSLLKKEITKKETD